ncbi:MAG: hypothetical protein AAF485_17745 [Chloroflexota bacterium]
MAKKTVRAGWQLLVRVELDKSRRVQCQCRGCGRTVYADVHMIQWPDGEIACWGSRCFEREMGIAGRDLQAVYSRVNGRKLTEAERDLLDANREALIALIKGVEEDIKGAEQRRAKAVKAARAVRLPGFLDESAATPQQSTSSAQKEITMPINYNDRSHRFTIVFRNQAGEIVKQLYRGDEQFCRRFIEREIGSYPTGTEAEIVMTRTGQSIYQRRKI